MTRQDLFKAELKALLSKYTVSIQVEEETHNYQTYASGVSFYSYVPWDPIDFTIDRCHIDADSF